MKQIKTALRVNPGIEQPSNVNSSAIERLRTAKKKSINANEFASLLMQGNRSVLSQAITMIESTLEEHQQRAQQIIERCLPYSGNSIRIGITGVPGVGKSTFIEAFGMYLTSLNHKVAVLAIDPSSARSKGSILGDKTRMEDLSNCENAFIRPSPSAGSLGGVSRKTRESIILCEAAGFDIILVETVGVGQSEIAVHSMVDFFLLLMLAGAGDELQGIKRGIMEMSDALVINKADSDNILKAKAAKVEYQNALHLFPPKESGWTPITDTCSALQNQGIDRIWEIVQQHHNLVKTNLFFEQNRKSQEIYRMKEGLNELIMHQLEQSVDVKSMIKKMEKKISNNEISSYKAANKIFELFLKIQKS